MIIDSRHEHAAALTSNDDGIVVRAATIDDIEQLCSIRIAFLSDLHAMDAEYMKLLSASLHTYIKAHIGRELACFGAWSHGEPVSSAWLQISEKPGDATSLVRRIGLVTTVFTTAEYRQRDIASQVLTLLIEEAKRLNCTRLELSATDMGKSVYSKLGFTPTAPTPWTSMVLPLI